MFELARCIVMESRVWHACTLHVDMEAQCPAEDTKWFPGDTLTADPLAVSGAQSSRRGSSTNLGSGQYASVPAALAVESDGESEQGAGRGGVAGWFRRQH